MDVFDEEILALWRQFDQQNVRYIMLGGFATNFMGIVEPQMTWTYGWKIHWRTAKSCAKRSKITVRAIMSRWKECNSYLVGQS